jgi:hypothetical protein
MESEESTTWESGEEPEAGDQPGDTGSQEEAGESAGDEGSDEG